MLEVGRKFSGECGSAAISSSSAGRDSVYYIFLAFDFLIRSITQSWLEAASSARL